MSDSMRRGGVPEVAQWRGIVLLYATLLTSCEAPDPAENPLAGAFYPENHGSHDGVITLSEVPFQTAIEVFDALRAAGFDRVCVDRVCFDEK